MQHQCQQLDLDGALSCHAMLVLVIRSIATFLLLLASTVLFVLNDEVFLFELMPIIHDGSFVARKFSRYNACAS